MTQRDRTLENSDPKGFLMIIIREYSGIELVAVSVQGKEQRMKTMSKREKESLTGLNYWDVAGNSAIRNCSKSTEHLMVVSLP